jgi:lysophospholipase L1-like esterase
MKFKENIRILFQGDSITDGARSRNEDLNHVMGHGYAYIIAGKLGLNEAENNYKFFNRGISGNRVVDLYGRWKEDTLNLKPDVLSILIGVNDAGAEINYGVGTSIEKYEKVLKLLLDETKEANPEVTVVLCEPFILPVGPIKEKWDTWNEDIKKRQIVVRKLAEQYNCIFVGLQDKFNAACKKTSLEYWLWDGVHPTPAGHELIAREWLKAVEQY